MSALIRQATLGINKTVASNETVQLRLADFILDEMIEERRRHREEILGRMRELRAEIEKWTVCINHGKETLEDDETKRDILEKNMQGLQATRDEKLEQCNAQQAVLDEKTRGRDKLASDYEAMESRRERQRENAAECTTLERDIVQCRSEEGEAEAQLGKLRGEIGEETLKLYAKLSQGESRMEEGRAGIKRLTERLHEVWGKVRQDDFNL